MYNILCVRYCYIEMVGKQPINDENTLYLSESFLKIALYRTIYCMKLYNYSYNNINMILDVALAILT